MAKSSAITVTKKGNIKPAKKSGKKKSNAIVRGGEKIVDWTNFTIQNGGHAALATLQEVVGEKVMGKSSALVLEVPAIAIGAALVAFSKKSKTKSRGMAGIQAGLSALITRGSKNKFAAFIIGKDGNVAHVDNKGNVSPINAEEKKAS